MLLTVFLFQKWLGSPFPEDFWAVVTLDALTQLQFTPCETLTSIWNRLCLTLFSSLRSSMLLVHIFLHNFFLPVNCALISLIQHSMNSHPFSNDPLWLTLFVEGVNDRLLDHCQVSSIPHYCGFKEQEISNLYCMDGHLLKIKCKYSNILRYWFWLTLAVSSNHQKQKNILIVLLYM